MPGIEHDLPLSQCLVHVYRSINGRIERFVQKASDSTDELRRKCVMFLFAVCLLISGVTAVVGSSVMNWPTHLLLSGVIGCLNGLWMMIYLVTVKEAQTWLFCWMIVVVSVTTVLADLWALQWGHVRVWAFFILLTDVLIFLRVDMRIIGSVVGIASVWVAFAELAVHFDFFNLLPGSISKEDRWESVCGCGDPPCPPSVINSVNVTIIALLIFLLDFYFTSSFARQVWEEKRRLERSVIIVQEVAMCLAAFDTESASALLTEHNATLPEDMQRALVTVLDNLQSYRPFLPESLFNMQAEGDDLYAQTPPLQISVGATTPSNPLSRGHRLTLSPGIEETQQQMCILFTDIVSSTTLWGAVPMGMHQALLNHNTIVRKTAADFGGYEVKTIGDSFMYSFAAASAALSFSLAVNLNLLSSVWPESLMQHPLCARDTRSLWGGLTIRIGMHVGAVAAERNALTLRIDYFGQTVNLAARLEAAALHGTVALCGSVLHNMENTSIAHAVRELGMRTFKGISQEIEVVAVAPHALKQRFDHQLDVEPIQIGGLLHEADAEREPIFHSTPHLLGVVHDVGSGTIGVVESVYTVPAEHAVHGIGVRAKTAMDWYSTHLTQVIVCAERCEGRVMSVIGAVTVCTWNCVRHCLHHAHHSLRFVECLDSEWAGQRPEFAVGVATGTDILHGALGPYSQRFMSVISHLVPHALLLTACARKVGTLGIYSMERTRWRMEPALHRMLLPLEHWEVDVNMPGWPETQGLEHIVCEVVLPCRTTHSEGSLVRHTGEAWSDGGDHDGSPRTALQPTTRVSRVGDATVISP